MEEFYTLALSGGGYKGLFTAHVLSELEKELGCPIAKKIDLLAGTSIGGIIAIALALEIPAKKIEDLFIEHGNDIFKKRSRFSTGYLLKSKYNNEGLRRILTDLFNDKTISDLHHKIIIPTVNYTEGKPQIFKTPHHTSLCKDKSVKLVDVALFTSAAPIYFPVCSTDLGDFVDGGLVANHPGYFAMIEAEKYLGQDENNIYQLHIGTISQKFTSSSKPWILNSSLLSWGAKIMSLLFSCQEQSTDNILGFFLKNRYYSIDSNTADNQAQEIGLDKISTQSSRILKQKADDAVKVYLGTPAFQKLKQHNAPDFNI